MNNGFETQYDGSTLLYYFKKGFTYYGLDASKEMCDLAKQNKDVTEIRNESFSGKVSYEDSQFGLITSKYAIQTSDDTLSEYINKDFLEKFSLIDLVEGSDFPNSEQIDGDMYPTYLIVVARKK